MKTALILTAISGLYIMACSLEYPEDAFNHCIDNQHWVITDTHVQEAIVKCELVTGYKSNYEGF